MKKPFAIALLLSFGLMQVSPSFAAPSLLGVDAGSVTSETEGNTTNASASDRSISNWDFDIWQNEVFNLSQPSAQAVALFRDFTGDASHIFGSLNANGRLFLLNTNGILFGQSAAVNVGGLVAWTLDISNSDFLAGRYKFAQNGTNPAAVINQGNINGTEFVTLLGGAVRNEGTIIANYGSVNLGAGKQATVDIDNTGLVSVAVDDAVTSQVTDSNGNTLKDAIANTGTIQAKGGYIQLVAKAAEHAFDHVINHSGVVEAQSVSVKNGVIVFDGGDEGIVSVTGTVDASGKGNGQTGGEVQILGDKVALYNGARVDVSGNAGGGKALIGGDLHGEGTVRNASRTYVGPDAKINADAVTNGDGGKVVVWADGDTRYYGNISAKGGEESGNGGSVEVSGKEDLAFRGDVNTTAKNGETGTLLLDPTNIVIANGAGGADDAQVNDSQALFGDVGATFTISENKLEGLFSNVILQATNDITLNDLTDNNLHFQNITDGEYVSFQAGRHITMNSSDMISTVGGDIHLEADSPHTGVAGAADGTGTLTLGSLDSQGGDITLIGADFALSGPIDAGAGNVAIGHAQNAVALNLGSSGGSPPSDAELDQIFTSGTVTLGEVTTKGTNGAGTGASTRTASTVTFDGLTQGSKNFLIKGADISAGSLSTTGNVALTATTGDITDNNGGTTNITANNLTATADDSINLDTSVSDITATTTNGDISIDEANAVTLTNVNAGDDVTITAGGTIAATSVTANSNGNINLTATSGNVAVGSVTASGDDVTINADNGAITDANGASNNVTADVLNLDADDGIDLDTNVSSITAENDDVGNITIDEASGVTLTSVTTNNGSVTVNAGDQITATSVIAGGSGDVNLTTASGDIVIDAITASGDTVTLNAADDVLDDADGTTDVTASDLIITAGDDIDLDTDITNLNAVSTGAGDITIDEAGALNLQNVTSAGGNIDVGAAGTLTGANVVTSGAGDIILATTVGSLAAGTITAGDDVTLTATAGSITDSNGGTTNISGDALTATASTGVDLDTSVNSITASTTGAGDISLDEANVVTLTSVTTANGDVTVNGGGAMTATLVTAGGAGGDVNLTTTSGNILAGALTAAGDTVTLNAAGAITDNNAATNNVTASSLNATATTGVDLDTTVTNLTATTTSVGNINLDEFDGANVLNVNATAGNATVTSATGSLAVTTVSASGAANLTATAGSITDANGATNNISATTLNATASTGIDLDTNVGSITANTTGAGSIDLSDANDVTLTSVTTANGNITASAAGKLIATTVTAGGAGSDVNLTTTAGGDIIVDTVTAADDVTLTSAGDISENPDSSPDVIGDVFTFTSVGNVDLDTTVNSVNGNVTGAGLIDLNETDAITLTSLTTSNGSIAVNAGGTITATSVTAGGSGDVNLTTTAGNIVAGLITATSDSVTLNSAGSITENGDGGADIVSDDLNATASTGIDLDTTVVNITASNTGAGSINIDETNAANLLNVNATAGNATVTAAAGNLNVTSMSASGTATLTATAGAITDANGLGNNVTGTSLVASSATGIDLDTTVTNLTATTTGAGNINLDEADGANLLNINAAAGNATVTSATGNLNVTTVGASGTATLTATGGAITDADGNNDVTATTLIATAANGIDLDTTLTNLTASTTGAGNITVDELNALTVTSASTANGDVTINAGGAMTATSVIANGVGGDVALSTTAGSIDLGQVVAEGDRVTINSASNITDANGGANNVTSDQLVMLAVGSIGSADRIETEVSALEAAAGGNIRILNDGDLTIGGITALNGVSSTGGNVEVAALGDLDISESVSVLGANTVQLAGSDNVSIASGASVISSSGTIQIGAGEDFSDGTFDQDGNINGSLFMADGSSVFSTSGNITLQARRDVDVSTVTTSGGGDVTVVAQSGDISDVTAGESANITGDVLTLTSLTGINSTAADGNLNTSVNSIDASVNGTGNLSILEADAVTLTDIDTANGAIQITSGGTMTATDVQTLTNNDSNDITLITTSGNILLGTIGAGTNGDVTIASAGTVVDNNAAANNITADDLVVTGTSIGSGDAIETAVSNLEGQATAGNFQIANTGALPIGGITAMNGVTATGNVVITSASPMTVSEQVSSTAGGNITLASLGSSSGDDLTIGADVTATGGNGNVTLVAGDTVSIGNNTVSAAGTGDITIVAGEDFTDGIDAAHAHDGNLGAAGGRVIMTGGTVVKSDDGDISIDAQGNLSPNGALINADGDGDLTKGNVSLISHFGSVGFANVIAGGLALVSSTGIGTPGQRLQTSVSNFEANGGTGGVYVENTGAMTIGGVDASLTGVTASGGDIEIFTKSPLTVDENVTNTGGGDIILAATGTAATDDLTLNADVLATGGNGSIILAAGDDVTVTGTRNVSAAGSGDVTVAAGENYIDEELDQDGNANGDLTMTANTTFQSTNGQVNLYATDDIALGIVTTSDLVRINAGGAVTDTNGGTNNVTANKMLFNTGDGFGTDAARVETDVNNLEGTNGANGVFIINTGALNIGGVDAGTDGVSSTSGDIKITTTGNFTVNEDVSNGTDDVLLAVLGTDTDDLTVNANVSAGDDVLLAAGDDVNLSGASVSVLGGNTVDVRAGEDLSDSETVFNQDGNAGGDINMTAGASVASQDGNITLDARNNIALGTADANSDLDGVSGDVLVQARAGAITDANGAAMNVTGDQVGLISDDGVGTNANRIETQANNLEAVGNNSGVFVQNTGDLTIGGAGFATGVSGAGELLVTATGALTVNEAVASTGGGNITLAALGSLDADDLNLNANVTATGGNGNIVLTGGDDVNFAAGITAGANGTGSVTVAAGEDFSDGSLNRDGNVTGNLGMNATSAIQSQNGNLILDARNNVVLAVANADSNAAGVVGNVTIGAQNGAITDANGATLNITGNLLGMTAASGIGASGNPIETRVNNLEASGGNGGIFVANTGALVIGGVSAGLTGLTATGGNIVVTSASPMTVNEQVSNNGGGDITLASLGATAADDLTINANVAASGGNGAITLVAGDTVTLNNAQVSTKGTGDVTIMGGEDFTDGIDAAHAHDGNLGAAGGQVTMTGTSSVTVEDGDVDLDAQGDLTVGAINMDSDADLIEGSLSIISHAGAVLDGNGNAVNINGGNAVLSGAAGIGASGNALETNLDRLEAFGGTGGVYVDNQQDLIIGGISPMVGVSATGGDIEVSAKGSLTADEDVSLTGAGHIYLTAEGSADGDNLDINANVTAGTGDILLTAGDSVSLGAGSIVSTTGTGAVTVAAGEDYSDNTLDQDGSADGEILMNGTSEIHTDEGNILLDARSNVNVSVVNADSDAAGNQGDVTIFSRLGKISDSNGAARNITGDDLEMTAQDGIATNGDRLETKVNNLEAVTSTGGIFVANTGALEIGNSTGSVIGVTAGGGDIVITALSPITVNAAVSDTGGGDITLAALGAAATDDITVDANITATGGNGDINLISGDTTSILAGRTISAAGTGTVTIAAGEDFTDGILNQDGNASGDVTMASTASILTEDGNILLDAARDVSVATVNAESDNDTIFGDVTVVARSGAITDSNGAALNITTDRLILDGETGVATDANRLETKTERLEALSNAGGVYVTNDGALTIGGVSAAYTGVSAADAVLIFTANGPMTVNENVTNSGAGDIALAALGTSATADMQVNASVSSLGGGDTFVVAGDTVTLGNGSLVSASGAGEVNVLAGEDATDEIINQDGNAGGDVLMNANSSIETQDGDILIDAANNVEVASVDADSDAAGAAGTVTINARTGTITDNNANLMNVSGGALAMTAAAGIATNSNRLETSVDNLEASGGTGGVFVENSGALTIGGVTAALTGVSATGSDIKVSALSPLTVIENVSNTGGGNITLAAKGAAGTDDLAVTSGANVSATGGNGTVLLVAGDTVSIDDGSTVSAVGTGTVTVAAGEDFTDEILDQDGNAGGDIVMGATGTVQTTSGNILLDAADSVTLGVVNANSDAAGAVGDARILARAGSITDANAGTLNVTADGLEMQAATGIGVDGDRIETQVNNLEAAGGTGGIFVANTGNLTIGAVTSALTGLLATGSDIKVTTTGAMNVDEDVLNSGGGNILLASLGSAATDDLTVNAEVTANGGNGNILLAAGDTVTLIDQSNLVPGADSDNVTVSATGTGEVRVIAGEDLTDSETVFNQDGNAGGDITMQVDSVHGTQSRILSEDGNIILDAADDITITRVDADSNDSGTAGDVSLYARGGSITDVNDVLSPAGKVLNIDANELDMRAAEGIATDANRLETTVDVLAAQAGTSGAGGIFVNNTGALVIDTIVSNADGAAVVGLTSPDDIKVTAASPLTINSAVSSTNGGNIILAAKGSAAADDVAVNANVSATGGNGNITIAAGDSLTQAAGVTVSADGTGNVNVLAGEDLTDSETVFNQDGNAGGDITMDATAAIQSQDGNLLIDARDNTVLAVANANSDADATLGDVSVLARDGSITDANGATLNVTGDDLAMLATEGIATDADRLETAVNNLDASGGTGGVYVSDNGTLEIGNGNSALATALTGVSATGQDIKVTSSSTLTVNEAVSNSGGATAGQGNILLGSVGTSFGDDIILNANVAATGGNANVVIVAGDDLTVSNGATVSTQGTGQVELHAGEDLTDSETVFNQDGNATADIRMGATGAVSTQQGDVLLDARDDIEVGVVNADSNADNNRGDVTLIARNSSGSNRNIIDMNGSTLNITADELDMTASTGIATDGDRLETKVNTLAATGGTGGIYVANTGALVIGDVTGFTGVLVSGLTATGEDIKVTALSPITVNSAILDSGAGNIVLGALGSAVTDDITVNANITASGGNGNILLGAGDSISQSSGTVVSATGTGKIDYRAGEDLTDSETSFSRDGNAGGDIVQGATAETRSEDGDIEFDARDNATIAVLNANSDADATLGDVQVYARSGAITDANGATLNVTADDLAMLAATGITTNADRLETQVNNLDASGGTGGVFVENTGDLEIGNGDSPLSTALTGVSATGNNIKVFTTGALTISEDVANSGGGDIQLATKGAAATNDVNVNANVRATGGNGNIVVAAGDTVTMADGMVIGADGTGDVTVASGEDFTDEVLDQDGNTGAGGGDILMGPTSAIQSQDGDVLLDSADDILLGIANGDSDGDNVRGDVTTLARAGSITDANAANLNITAQTATLIANGNIGTAADPIEINAVTVTGGNTGAGSTFLAIIGDSILDGIDSPLGDIGITGTNSVWVNAITAPNGTINMNIGNSIFATGDPANDFTSFNLWLVAQNGVVGTAEAPILVDLQGGSFFFFAGGQINELSANIHSNVARNGITFLGTPPGLVLLDNHFEGGGNLQSLFKSMSIQYKIGQEAFNSYGQFGQYGLYDQPALVIPEDVFTEKSFIESQSPLIKEPEILLEQGAFTDL